MQTAFHIVESSLVRCDQTGFSTHLDRHVAQGHTAFHAQCTDSIAAKLHHVTGSACAAGFTDNRQHDIFRGDTCRRLTFDFDFHGFRAALFQGLRRQNVLDFGGSDTKRQRTERAVRGGMGVAADDGHSRQGDALLRTHYVDDALIRVVQIVQLNAEGVAVLNQLLHLDTRHLARRVDVFGLSRHVVIHRGEGFTRLANGTIVRAQTVKGLR
ncbi:hypothetical protein D3C72_911330 [compost metagenome]